MPMLDRYFLISSAPVSLIPFFGTSTTAITSFVQSSEFGVGSSDIELRTPSHHFKQELKYLDVPPCFAHRLAPRVQAVAMKVEPMNVRTLGEQFPDRLCELRIVLRIRDDGNLLSVLVRCHSGQAFQHFVPLDLDRTAVEENV